MAKSLIPQRLSLRAFAKLLVHTVVFAAVYWFAFWNAYDFRFTEHIAEWPMFWLTLPAVLVVKLVVFYASGHCHRSFHHISFSDLTALLVSSTVALVVIMALNNQVTHAYSIPLRALLLDWGLTILSLGCLRAFMRLVREEVRPRLFGSEYHKALIIGANQSGETLARHLLADNRLKYRVVGFLDPDANRHGSTWGGVPVLGRPSDTVRIAGLVDVNHVLVISGLLVGGELRRLVDDCKAAGLTLKVIPALDELVTGNYSLQLRDVDINDLLRREPVVLNSDAISAMIAGRTVMVTGGGGSIGSEICRQVLKFRPRTLLLVERAENSLFLVEQEFRQLRSETTIIPCICDITDRQRLEQIFREHRPSIVFHAAAHKHVPMMEYNPGEAIKNNVRGTQQLAELADEFAVQEFVMISTDKAVNPTSVMGVSKHLAERFVHAFSEVATTKFVVVRFGNVLASNGSVVPIFQEQIRRGGPITVTHPEIKRFFMTIPEASQLVLQAAAMGRGGEIFVLDMGESVRIVDLARDLIRLSGLQPDDIEIVFTGLRPGEKLFEELYFADEEMQPTPHPKVFVAYHRPFALAHVRKAINELIAVSHEDAQTLRNKIKEIVPEYECPDAPQPAQPEEVVSLQLNTRRPVQRKIGAQ
jgi:FlaA1/EpsC-like NDP-sugar epimerase